MKKRQIKEKIEVGKKTLKGYAEEAINKRKTLFFFWFLAWSVNEERNTK